MWRILVFALMGAICAAAPWPVLLALAQPSASDQVKAAEFSRLFNSWQQTKDPDEGIRLAEQALALELQIIEWPFPAPRADIKGALLFGLGNGYFTRRHGSRADDLEKALAAFQAERALHQTGSHGWALAQSNLAAVYAARIRGVSADNLENAIASLEAGLTVLTQPKFPAEWAALQNNLANAYEERIHGDRADNLEKAIAAYEAALIVRTRDAFPVAWAQTQNNLADAHKKRLRGVRADNIEKAVSAYQAALTIFTRESAPEDWANIQNNLGAAYQVRLNGDRADNLDKAIAHLEAALTVQTQDALPMAWALSQVNLANAYYARVRGDRADNLLRAVAAYEAALMVRTRDAFPRLHLYTARLLGGTFIEIGDWANAEQAHSAAREAFLLLFGQGLEETEARDLITDAGPLFAEGAYAAAQTGKIEVALELASEGRARLIAVALKLQTLELPADKRRQLDEHRAKIRLTARIVEATHGTERAAALETLIGLRRELLDIVKSADGPESRARASLAQASALVATGGAVLMPIVTKAGGKVLIIANEASRSGRDVSSGIDSAKFPTPSLTVINLPELTTEKVDVLMRGGHNDRKTGGWLGAYNINYIEDQAEQDRRWPDWLAAIDDLGPALWRLGGDRLHAALKERGITIGARLVWLPTGALGIVPLGLAQDPVSKRRFADDFEIVYAPSLEVLAAARDLIAKPAPASLAAVTNPTSDLPGTEKEGAIVLSHFASDARTLLQTEAATPEAVLAALKGRTHWHFASHGTFSWEDARRSALVMHDQAQLTVGRLQETDGLGRPRLVVLSACETGLYDIDRNPDEFVGLPGAFAALGAAGVLGTLWPVSDDATALLMAKFYELHIGSGFAPPTALSRAQAWLRQATNDDLTGYVRTAAAQGRLETRHLAEIEQALSVERLAGSRNRALVEWISGDPVKTDAGKTGTQKTTAIARPYAHPYFWAGFIHTGL